MKEIKDIRFEQVYCTNCRYWNKLLNSIENNLDCPKPCNVCYPYTPEDSTTMLKRPQYIKGYEVIRWQDDVGNTHEYRCKLIGVDFTKGEDKTVYVTLQNGSVIEKMMSYETCAMSCSSTLSINKQYDKYLKRVKNRKKLYDKLKKLGR